MADAPYARQLCKVHYRRLLSTGDVQADKPVRHVSGTGYVHHTGYRVVPVPVELRCLTNGESPTAEHRLVMAQMLGRTLFRRYAPELLSDEARHDES